MLVPISTGTRFALCPISAASEDSNQSEVYAAAPNRYEKSMLPSAVVLARETPVSRRPVHQMSMRRPRRA